MQEACNKAARYCAAAEHCDSEVREKLFQWGVPVSLADSLIARLHDEGYIDSRRYCRAFVHDKIAFSGWGRRKIRQALLSKGLPDELVGEALSEADRTAYLRNLENLVRRRKGRPVESTIRFLLQRGYDYDDIRPFLPSC